MSIRLLCFVLFACAFATNLANATGDGEFHPKHPKQVEWKFDGIMGVVDRAATQRGYKVYKEVCASCHSMVRMSFRNLEKIGFSTEEVKAIAAQYSVTDGPNDAGEMFERPGRPSDHFVSPFKNSLAARAAHNGALPVDLSLIVKARKDGPNYIYSLLTGYASADPDADGLYHNDYFATGRLAMNPPLSDGIIEYSDGSPTSVENLAHDVVTFLQWVAEPEMEERKRLGLKVMGFLVILTVVFFFANERIWRH